LLAVQAAFFIKTFGRKPKKNYFCEELPPNDKNEIFRTTQKIV